MIDSVSAGSALGLTQVRQQATVQPQSPPPGEATAFDIALQIQDVQVNNLKRTLDAQTQLLDLLV